MLKAFVGEVRYYISGIFFRKSFTHETTPPVSGRLQQLTGPEIQHFVLEWLYWVHVQDGS